MKDPAVLLKQVAIDVILENTRVLTKGIKNLHDTYEQIIPGNDWNIDQLAKFVLDTYQSSIQADTYLRQNPHVDFFRFRYPTPNPQGMPYSDSRHIGAMILLYHQLELLRNDRTASRTADVVYEQLCNCVRIITGTDMCYITYRRQDDTKMLCASSVQREQLHTTLGAQQLGIVLDLLAEQDKPKVSDGIFLREYRWETAKKPDYFLILPIDLYGKPHNAGEQLFLVCQSDKVDRYQIPAQVRDALFLRGRLMQMLERDLSWLLYSHNEYRNIEKSQGNRDRIRILHISDLHVTADNMEDIIGCIQMLDTTHPDFRNRFDFMVITGDVAQGRCAAGDLEKNYDCAARVIRELAYKVWSVPEKEDASTESCILKQEWKKRTIIIPGNHDYASMNELETRHDETHRTSIGGTPAVKEGSSMAKFTYYIDFLRQLLDMEIGELIDNRLNEFRNYDELGISFLSLNTSMMANPMRNNKVHLDRDFIKHIAKRITRRNGSQNGLVCLCHHGPDYKIDYVSDQYYETYICEEITKVFSNFAKAILEDNIDEAKAIGEDLQKILTSLAHPDKPLDNMCVQTWILADNITSIPDDIDKRVVRARMKSRLYSDFNYLYEMLQNQQEGPIVDERYHKILFSIERALKLSENDRKSYQNTFQQKLQVLQPTVVLSGHTHQCGQNTATNSYCANRFFTKVVEENPDASSDSLMTKLCLHYGVCEITGSSRTEDLKKECEVDYHFKTAKFKREEQKIEFECVEEETVIQEKD